MERNLISKLPVKERIEILFSFSALYLSLILVFFAFYTMLKEGLELFAYISIAIAMIIVAWFFISFKSNLETEIKQNEHYNILNKPDDVEEKRDPTQNQVTIDLQNQIIDLQGKLISRNDQFIKLQNQKIENSPDPNDNIPESNSDSEKNQ